MCRYCLSILGPHCKPHEESNCPLKKATYCSTCGKGSHMQINCPKKLLHRLDAIPNSEINPPSAKLYILPNTNDAYMTYLQNVSIEPSVVLEENSRLVAKHLLKRGYILTNPLQKNIIQLPYTMASYLEYLKTKTPIEIDQSSVEKHLIDGGFVLKLTSRNE